MSGMISAVDKLRDELQACKLTRTKPSISVVDNACDEIEAEVSELLSSDKKTIYDWLYFAFALEHNDLFFEFVDKLSNDKSESGTCQMEYIETWEYPDGEEEYLCKCSECGRTGWEPACNLPKFCGGCGRMVKR